MQSDYRVTEIYTEEDTGDVIARCYDVIYGEYFEKYLGQGEDFDSKENASNLLNDSNYYIPDDIRADIEDIFGVAEFDAEQDYDSYQFYDFDDEDEEDDDEMDQKALAILGKRESFNIREALNRIDLDTYNKYDLLNLYESCNLSENEKRVLANLVYDQNDPSVIYDTLNDRFLGKEIEMPERVKDGVIHEEKDEFEFDDEFNAYYAGYTEEDKDENSAYNKLKKNVKPIEEDLEDIEFIVDTYLPNLLVSDTDKPGKYEMCYRGNDSVSVIVEFDPSYSEYVFTIDGEGPHSYGSYEYIQGEIERALDKKLWKNESKSIEDMYHKIEKVYETDKYVVELHPDAPKPYWVLDKTVVNPIHPEETFYDKERAIRFINESKSIKESDEETPYTKEEIERDLKSITHNFTDKEGELKCGFEEEKNLGVEILKQHYKVVEASGDDRRDGTWYHISFAEPIEK